MRPKKFKFKLQKILDMKLKQEEDQKHVFTRALNKLRTEQQKLERLIQLRQQKQHEMKMKMELEELDAFEMQMYASYIERLKRDIALQREVVRKAEETVEIEKAKLQAIMAERKAFEKLKEKHYQRFLQEQEAEERKLIDELATVKFARKLMQESEN